MNEQFLLRSAIAYDRYTQELSDAIKYRDWVYDPSFALASDSDAYRKIMRDPVAAHAARYRRHLVAGPGFNIEPATDSEVDEKAAAIIEELIRQIQGFTDARLRIADAIFRGSSYEFIEGSRRAISVNGGGVRSWWVPQKLVNVDRRRFRIGRSSIDSELGWQLWSVDRRLWEPLEHPEWFVRSVFDESESSLGYGRGLLDTLYYFQAAKARSLQQSMRACERFGQGMLVAKIDNLRGPDGRPVTAVGRDGDSVASEWIDVLKKHAAEDVLVHDSRDEVSVVTGIGEGFKLLTDMINYLDASQVMTVLGATVNTMQQSGGSFALAKEQANSTEALVNADRQRISEDLTRDLVGLVWGLNRVQLQEEGCGGARMPRLVIEQQRSEDPGESAEVIAKLLGSGVNLRADEVYRKTGFTVPAADDEVVEGIVDVPGLDAFAPAPVEVISESSSEEDESVTNYDNLALNGAQVTALQTIVQAVSLDQLPAVAAVDLITVSFPQIQREVAARMIASASAFEVSDEGSGESAGDLVDEVVEDV